MRNALMVTGIGAIILAGGWWYLAHLNSEIVEVIEETEEQPKTESKPADPKSQGAAIGDENLATFKCDVGKTITAVFERDIVGLTLSDGRQITLREAPGSGIRYLSNDTKIEFRGKGNEGTLVENGTTTYANCLAS